MPLTFNGSTPENVNWNGVALSKVTYNGGVVWEKVSGVRPSANWNWFSSDENDTFKSRNQVLAPNRNGYYNAYITLLYFDLPITKPCTINVKVTFQNSSNLTTNLKCALIDPSIMNSINSISGADINNNIWVVGDNVTLETVTITPTGVTKEYSFSVDQSDFNTYYDNVTNNVMITFFDWNANGGWYVGGMETSTNPVIVNIV